MPLSRSAALLLLMGAAGSTACAQAIFAPRASALGAYAALVQDVRGFTANPAGLTGMKDWDIYTTTYTTTGTGGGGFVFSGFGLGKRFLGFNSLAVQYTPGTTLDVVKRATFRIAGLSLATDTLINYDEPLAVGYAARVSDRLSLGIQARMQTEKVSNPQYTLEAINDSLSTILPVQQTYQRDVWFADLAVSWKPADDVSLSALGRSLARITSRGIPSGYDQYALPWTRSLELGAAWSPVQSIRVSAAGSTAKRGALGAEWNPLADLSVRCGLYGDGTLSPFLDAVGVGIGYRYLFFEADASYVRFTSEANRGGTVASASFDPSRIDDLGMSPYAGDRASFSIRAILGNVRETPVRIEGVQLAGGVYPSAFQAMAYRPVGRVRVRNTSNRPVAARAAIFVDRLMDRPTLSQPVSIQPGETADVPLTAVFNDRVKDIPAVTIRDATVTVSAAIEGDYDDEAQARLVIHGRNDWDGTPESLRYFVTPDDPEVIRTSREIMLAAKDSLSGVPSELGQLRRAKLLCDAFAGRLVYVSDPKHLTEFVQYSPETLRSRAGDCTDMTVCFSSLLSSIGISTAFVDVVPPKAPEKAHMFLLFDTGVSPQYGDHVSSNPKRYILRKSKSGRETIWLPLETTAITRGFEEAWTEGAQQYFDDVELGLGLASGWVRIVDVY
ncbi:MAG TPA: hypothetical protein VL221_12350 [Bacteroidota bacterium]|nr:hypothetical protein [Bacteroidota bacterium]